MLEDFFERLASYVQRHAREILVVEVLLTVLLLSYIPSNFRFQSDLNKFFPQNPEIRAHERLQDYFGHDPSSYFINVVPKRGENVLTPDALRDQIKIIDLVRAGRYEKKGYITGHVSLAYVVEVFLRMNITDGDINPDWERSLLYATDEEIMRALGQTLDLLHNATSLESFQTIWSDYIEPLIWNVSDPSIRRSLLQLSPEDLFMLRDSILPRNADLLERTAESTLIVIWINGSLDPEKRKEIAVMLHHDIQSLHLSYIEPHETGADILAHDVDELTFKSNVVLGVGILFMICLILYLTFRRLSYVILPVLTMLVSVIWTIGTMLAFGVVFTAIDVAVIPLIVGLGVDDSVHLSKRYQEELSRGLSPPSAIMSAMRRVGLAIFLTSLTTVIAFLSNMVSSVGPIRTFGLICAVGISYAFFMTVTFQTALRYELDRYEESPEKIVIRRGPRLEEAMERAGQFVLGRSSLFAILVVLLLVSGLWGATLVRTNFRIEDFLPTEWESVNTYSEIEAGYAASSQSRVYFLLEGDVATVDTLKQIKRLVERISDDRQVVRIRSEVLNETTGNTEVRYIPRIYSVIDYIRMFLEDDLSLQEKYHFNADGTPGLGCTDGNVRDVLNAIYDHPTLKYKVGTLLHRGSHFDATAIRIFVDARSETTKAKRVYDDMNDDLKGVNLVGLKVNMAGYVISTITTIHSIQESQINSTVVAILISALLLAILFRNLLLGAVAVFPVGISAVWILGTMALTEYLHVSGFTFIPNISLNVLTVMVTALTIGLGVDYAIHMIERFREERRERGIDDALITSIKHTGTAIFISMITTVAGFLILLFSPMPITQHFGLISSLTMLYAFFLGIFFLPLLLKGIAKRSDSRRREETSQMDGIPPLSSDPRE